MGHGLGGLMINTFLETENPEWKRKYVHVFVPVAVPWAGYAKALYDYETGGFFNTPRLMRSYRYVYRTWDTAKLLLPLGQAWEDTRFFNDSRYALINDRFWLKDYFKKMVQPRHPGVNIISLYSTDVPTINSFELHGYLTYSKHTFGYGDGDGTVNACSLYHYHHLNDRNGFTHNVYHGYKYNHQEVLSSLSMVNIMKHING